MEPFEIFQILIAFISLFVAVVAMSSGFKEYKLTAKQKRSELLDNYRIKFEMNKDLKSILKKLDDDSDKLDKVERIERYHFLGIYEELALLMNSGLIKPEIAYYMFGYFAIKCWENDSFWKGLDKNSHNWLVFKGFVEKMKGNERNLQCTSSSDKLEITL